jgi:hypothetical protein
MTNTNWAHHQEALAALAIGLGVVGSVWGGFRVFLHDVGRVSTDDKVDKKLEDHNASDRAHPDVRKDVQALSVQDAALQEKIGMSKADVVELGAKLVHVMAYNSEPKQALKGHAAVFYERLYDRLVQRGVPVRDAVNEALDSPWPNRPK